MSFVELSDIDGVFNTFLTTKATVSSLLALIDLLSFLVFFKISQKNEVCLYYGGKLLKLLVIVLKFIL
jgi:hypothetical protein